MENIRIENIRMDEEDLLWIVKWNDFLHSLNNTIRDEETAVTLLKIEELEHIESIREVVDFKKLFSYLKEHQIEHPRAWVFQFEKSMNEILKFALSRFNGPHDKVLEDEVIDKYQNEINFINKQGDVISVEDMKDIPDELKEVLKFYEEYKTRVIDYEANVEYRKKYFAVRKGIELIPKESLFILTEWDDKARIFVGREYKDKFDVLLKEICFDLRSYELDESDIYEENLEDYEVNFDYQYLPYYDFQRDASLTEAIYRDGYVDFVNERAIVDAFEDDGRINIEL